MTSLENVVQKCVDFALPVFENAGSKENIMDESLDQNSFPAEFLRLEWEPLIKQDVAVTNLDTLVDVVLKRLITDTLVMETDPEDEEGIEQEKRTPGRNMRHRFNICAGVLDFCFHSRRYRKTCGLWCISFFGLFSTVTDLLAWPCSLLEFWRYPESRMEWFKMGNSLDLLPPGTTNLTSYKQPLFDKLRHWNDTLNTVQNNTFLNTPLHYEMKFKLEKFVSELLPIYEESNFNRSALISNKQSSGNSWNKTITSSAKTDNSSENVFATDYNYVFDNLLSCPLEFLYKPLEFKIEMDRLLTPLLDAIFEIEEDFYKNLRRSHGKLSDINEMLNSGFPVNFETMPKKAPRYMRISKKINDERADYWKEYMKLDESISSMVQPTLFDISISNLNSLYQQMMRLENDFYRKQFLMQLYFSVALIRNILTSKEVENYYKSCYQKEKPSKSVNFANLTDGNLKKTLALCSHIIDNRIVKFYQSRDGQFLSILQNFLASDSDYLKSKVDGFKQFQNFKNNNDPLEKIASDETFKKFGFIKLGNKAMSNVWKISTGLELIDKKPLTAEDHFEILREKWNLMSNDKNDIIQEDEIVKQWQSLRSLRSKYLFSFNDVDETVGISGLFDATLIQEQSKDKEAALERLKAKLNSAHRKKLKEARAYMEQRQKRTRPYGAEPEETLNKKLKPDTQMKEEQGEDSSIDIPMAESTNSMGNSQIIASQVSKESTAEGTSNDSVPLVLHHAQTIHEQSGEKHADGPELMVQMPTTGPTINSERIVITDRYEKSQNQNEGEILHKSVDERAIEDKYMPVIHEDKKSNEKEIRENASQGEDRDPEIRNVSGPIVGSNALEKPDLGDPSGPGISKL